VLRNLLFPVTVAAVVIDVAAFEVDGGAIVIVNAVVVAVVFSVNVVGTSPASSCPPSWDVLFVDNNDVGDELVDDEATEQEVAVPDACVDGDAGRRGGEEGEVDEAAAAAEMPSRFPIMQY
jgi:hypothetical protein